MKNRIKELRESSNISQRKLANSIGISQQAIANYETGERTPRNEEIWKKLSDYFHVPISYIQGYGKSLIEIKNHIYDLISDYGCGFQSDNLLPEETVDSFQDAINYYCQHIPINVNNGDDLYDLAYTNDKVDYKKRNYNFDKIFKDVFTNDFLMSLSTDMLDNDMVLVLFISVKLRNFIINSTFNKQTEKKRSEKLNINISKVKKNISQKEVNLEYNLDNGSKNEIKNSINDMINTLQNILKKF